MRSFKREQRSIWQTCKRKAAYLRREERELDVLNEDGLGTMGPCSAIE